MATLIKIKSSNLKGKTEGRCDAKCYNAQHPDCTCVCGGKNHGVGIKQALRNTRELAAKALDEPGIEYVTHIMPKTQSKLF